MENDPFHDCYKLELAMCQMFGFESRWYHSAGWYSNPANVRDAMLAVTKRIRARLDDILTIDARLADVTSSILDDLEAEARNIGKYHNQLEIIAHLLTLIAYLLGYARMTGKPLRQVVYFQTPEQARLEEHLAQVENPWEARSLEMAKRREVAQMLHAQGLRQAQIARILKEPEHRVREYLREDTHEGK